MLAGNGDGTTSKLTVLLTRETVVPEPAGS